MRVVEFEKETASARGVGARPRSRAAAIGARASGADPAKPGEGRLEQADRPAHGAPPKRDQREGDEPEADPGMVGGEKRRDGERRQTNGATEEVLHEALAREHQLGLRVVALCFMNGEVRSKHKGFEQSTGRGSLSAKRASRR
jgi:hypothetical protein